MARVFQLSKLSLVNILVVRNIENCYCDPIYFNFPSSYTIKSTHCGMVTLDHTTCSRTVLLSTSLGIDRRIKSTLPCFEHVLSSAAILIFPKYQDIPKFSNLRYRTRSNRSRGFYSNFFSKGLVLKRGLYSLNKI